jgi:hypothetical protein
MKITNTTIFILFIIFLFPIICFSQQSKGITNDAGTHYIGNEYSLNVNQRIRIEIFSKDSSYHFVVFDSILAQPKKLFLVTVASYADSIRHKYQNDIIVPFPTEISGNYFLQYISRDTSFTDKFILLK